jgi:hypothetical protein
MPGEIRQAGKAGSIFRDPREIPVRASASVGNIRDSLKPHILGDETRVKIVSLSGIFRPEADDMIQRALGMYIQVAILVQQGQISQALELAVTISVDHLRGRALLLANYSRRL